MAENHCIVLIGLLWLSVIIGLCSAAPLDKVKKDNSKDIADWPIRDTEQYEYNPLKGNARIVENLNENRFLLEQLSPMISGS